MRQTVLAKEIAGRTAIADYLILFKPGIVGLVLVSTLTGIYLGGRVVGGTASLPLIFLTLAGVGLATVGSAALNNYFDRDIDALMERTKARALVTGTVTPLHALVAGLVFLAAAMVVLGLGANPLTAALTMGAALTYVVLYAMVLKRRSSWANQVGGIAGALPPVIGIAAVTGTVGTEALLLFAMVALWQQPHALSLALKYRLDYEDAGIPVVPVARGVKGTKLRILIYTLVLLPVSLVPFFTGMAGSLYLAVAAASGLTFVLLSAKFLFSEKKSSAFHFFFSILYLTAVFTALVIDLAV